MSWTLPLLRRTRCVIGGQLRREEYGRAEQTFEGATEQLEAWRWKEVRKEARIGKKSVLEIGRERERVGSRGALIEHKSFIRPGNSRTNLGALSPAFLPDYLASHLSLSPLSLLEAQALKEPKGRARSETSDFGGYSEFASVSVRDAHSLVC